MSTGNIEIVNNINTRFTNASDCDLCIYTETSNQKIHLGNTQGGLSKVSISTQGVGVGVSNPSYALDVSGDVNFSGVLRQGGIQYKGSQWTTTASSNAIYLNSSNVGIGTTNPQTSLHVTGDVLAATYDASSNGTAALPAYSWSNSSNTGMYLSNVGVIGFSTAGAHKVVIDSTGLAVGKTNATSALDVAGDINFTGILKQSGTAYVGSQFTTSNYGAGTSNFIYLLNSNVVIGDSNAASTNALTIKGNTLFNGNVTLTTGQLTFNGIRVGQTTVTGVASSITSQVPGISNDGSLTMYTLLPNQNEFRFRNSACNLIATLSNGRLGVGVANPVAPVDVSGYVSASTFEAKVTTGTAPFTVSSTTMVSNLNADLLDGQHSSFYQNATNINAGTLAIAYGGTGTSTLIGTTGTNTSKLVFSDAPTFTGTLNAYSVSASGTINANSLTQGGLNVITTGGGTCTGILESSQPYISMKLTTTQSIGNGGITAIKYAIDASYSANYSSYLTYNASTGAIQNATSKALPILISAGLHYVSNATGIRLIIIWSYTQNTQLYASGCPAFTTGDTTINSSHLLVLQPNEQIAICAYQNSGVAINVNSVTTTSQMAISRANIHVLV